MKTWLKDNLPTLAVFTIILATCLWFKNQFDKDALEEAQHQHVLELEKQRKAYDAQVEQINKVNAETIAKQMLLMEEYKNHLDSLQLEYDQKVKELEDLRVTKIQELTKKINQDPEAVLGNIAHKFGFEIIPVPEDVP
jgi:predicted negative regulator of RcsB-dependent stress response